MVIVLYSAKDGFADGDARQSIPPSVLTRTGYESQGLLDCFMTRNHLFTSRTIITFFGM